MEEQLTCDSEQREDRIGTALGCGRISDVFHPCLSYDLPDRSGEGGAWSDLDQQVSGENGVFDYPLAGSLELHSRNHIGLPTSSTAGLRPAEHGCSDRRDHALFPLPHMASGLIKSTMVQEQSLVPIPDLRHIVRVIWQFHLQQSSEVTVRLDSLG